MLCDSGRVLSAGSKRCRVFSDGPISANLACAYDSGLLCTASGANPFDAPMPPLTRDLLVEEITFKAETVVGY